jgi:hypothetical protein
VQLDKTHIAIRERSFGEILGLALQVLRTHFLPLVALAAAGALPMMLLNYWLLHSLVSRIDYEHDPLSYWLCMAYLVALEAPLAMAAVTIYLGQVTFADRISPRTLATNWLASLPQLFLLQFVLRAILLPLFLMPYYRSPYLSELILLERNRLFRSKSQPISTLKRSSNLHGNNAGELFGRWILSLLAGGLLWAILSAGVAGGLRTLLSLEIDELARHLYLDPLSLWMVVALFTVVRFLSYLDLRIRREGWEIELLMRAEAERMKHAVSFS